MIFNVIFDGIIALVKAVFSVIPDLPAVPPVILSAVAWIVDALGSVRFVFHYMYGDFFYPVFALAVLLMTFEHVYHLTMWIIKKLPIGVK